MTASTIDREKEIDHSVGSEIPNPLLNGVAIAEIIRSIQKLEKDKLKIVSTDLILTYRGSHIFD